MIRLISGNIATRKIRTLAIPVFEDADAFDDEKLTSCIRKAKTLPEFRGKDGESIIRYQPEQTAVDRMILVGLGPRASLDMEILRSFAGRVARRCQEMGLPDLTLAVPEKNMPLETRAVLESLATGVLLGRHRYDRYKTGKPAKTLSNIAMLVSKRDLGEKRSWVAQAERICQATTTARDWINTPPNDKQPVQLARDIAEKAKNSGLRTRILDAKSLQRQGFGAMLSVAAGSSHPPALVILESGGKSPRKTVALVGKGVTFDSGGINLKGSKDTLLAMKSDMSGAAAVAAAMLVAPRISPDCRFVGLIPLVENMPSGDATRPGDVITAYDGKTIEIGNTDAEGRLILADAMAYAVRRFQPDLMVDLATLTGACAMALGEKIAGVFSNDPQLAEDFVQAGLYSGERCWPMPMPEDYRSYLKSDIADICNMSRHRLGGAITAALFLQEFVGSTRWAHIDMAGTAYSDKETAYCGPGGRGFGVRLISRFLENLP
jgi:leucyl aminopeptidase